MPSVNDIVTVAEALEKSSVAVLQDRCVVVRNRNASCRRCVEACAPGALSVSNNEVHLDASSCVGCGGCAAVCPTEALVALDPADSLLDEDIGRAMAENGGRAVIACARVAAKHRADPRTYAQVPCLARVDERMLLVAAARGALELLLVDGDCATCKHRNCAVLANDAVTSADALLAAQGCAQRIRRVTGFPDELIAETTQGLFGSTRRGFFSDAVGAARETALAAAKATIAQELGTPAEKPGIGERLRVTDAGTLPLLETERHDAVLNALDELGAPRVERIESRLFATVSIEADRCNACGMCIVFCPTGALRRDPAQKVGQQVSAIEFSASDCVNCGLCADVCWKRALSVTPGVEARELFDFEPVVFNL